MEGEQAMKWKHVPDSRAKELFANFFWQDYKDWKAIVSEIRGMSIEEISEAIQEVDENFDGFELEESYDEAATVVQEWARSLDLLLATEEQVRETTWNLCKEYDASGKRRVKVLLVNFISTKLETLFGSETENLFRQEWLEEVGIFSEKYSYAD